MNLSPQDTMSLDKTYLEDLSQKKGSLTSHTVILAKPWEFPRLLGLLGLLRERCGRALWLYKHGCNREIVLEPDKAFSDTKE